ncbi:ATP-binding protein [Streptomyces filamentosus]|uniref:ATP-binding protein n=1 Tax=Streptomyces filamentosus TaxID=67294 RepID=UPI0033C2C041
MISALTAPAPRAGNRAPRPIYVTKGGDMLNPFTPTPTDPPSYLAKYTARDTAPGLARRDAVRTLLSWGLEQLADAAELVVSELVTNVLSHTSTRTINVTLIRTGETTARIVVMDTDRTEIVLPACPGDDEEAGRGLRLVASMAVQWGVERVVTGKLIWCDLQEDR